MFLIPIRSLKFQYIPMVTHMIKLPASSPQITLPPSGNVLLFFLPSKHVILPKTIFYTPIGIRHHTPPMFFILFPSTFISIPILFLAHSVPLSFISQPLSHILIITLIFSFPFNSIIRPFTDRRISIRTNVLTYSMFLPSQPFPFIFVAPSP